MEICVKIEDIKEKILLIIGENEKVAIFGKNGVGKTTFLRAIAGLYVPQKGYIKYDEEVKVNFPINFLSYYKWMQYIKSNVLYLDKASFMYDNLSIEGNINYFAAVGQVDKENIYKDIRRYAIEESMKKAISQLSEGTKQKLMIIFALNSNKKIILLDEPDKNLDEESMRLLLKDIINIKNKQIIMSTHLRKKELDGFINKFLLIDKKGVHINENYIYGN